MIRHILHDDQRAVSNLVSVVILTGVVLVGLGTIGALGYTQLGETQSQFDTEDATNQIQKISNGIQDVTETPRQRTRVLVNFGEQGGASVQEDAGQVSVSHVQAPELVGYENPGPEFECELPTGGIYGDDDLESGQPVYRCGDDSVISPDSNVSASIEDVELNYPGGGGVGPPGGGAGPPEDSPNQIDVETLVETEGGTIAAAEVYLYSEDDDDIIDSETVSEGADDIRFAGGIPDADYYRIEVVARNTDGDANGESHSTDNGEEQTLVPGSPVIDADVTTLAEHDLGAITYAGSGQIDEVAYQSGGVFHKQGTSSSVVERPNFELRRTNAQTNDGQQRPQTLVVPFTQLTAGENTALSSAAYITEADMSPQDHSTNHRYLEEEDVIEIEIESAYSEAWQRYLENEFGEAVAVRSGTDENTLVASFGNDEELYVNIRTSTVEVTG